MHMLLLFLVVGCFVHFRKPDVETLRQAAEVRLASSLNVVCIENSPMFVQNAEALGIRCVLDADYKSTSPKLVPLELQNC